MATTTTKKQIAAADKAGKAAGTAAAGADNSHRNTKVGEVVSTKMQKTIVVAVEMRKAHTKYKRIIRSTKKFYAHDETNTAHVGDVVRIRETRPLSKLKRWNLEEVVRRSALAQLADTAAAAEVTK
jgi:small subunit ribosomal protein S17